jgi:hypothetical protein
MVHCKDCAHFRRVRPMSQIFAAQLDSNASPVSEALGKIVEDEQKRREMEAQDKTSAVRLTTQTWSGRPMMSDFCGLREAEETYVIAEIKNADMQCADFTPQKPAPRKCRECRHRRPSGGKADDLLVEQTTSDVAVRDVSVGLSTSVSDSLLSTHREGVASRIAFELTGVYNSAGHLAMEPRYFDTCGLYSTPDDYVVCLMHNPHHTCVGWEPSMPTGSEPNAAPDAPTTTAAQALTTSSTAHPPADLPAPVYAETVQLAGAYIDFWEWMLDVRLSEQAKLDVITSMLDEAGHLRGDAQINERIAMYRWASSLDEVNREYQREENQAVLVAMLRADPTPAPAGLLAAYDAANPVLASGPPPLTPETADCYLGLLTFMHAAVAGQSPQPADLTALVAWRQKMTAEYDAMNPELRTWIADTPRILAGLRAKWSTFTDVERNAHIQQWAAQLSTVDPARTAKPVPRQPTPSQEWSAAAPGSTDELLAEIMRTQEDEERRLTSTNPELALQQRIQNRAANAQMLSNIMKTRHEASMAIINNMRS